MAATDVTIAPAAVTIGGLDDVTRLPAAEGRHRQGYGEPGSDGDLSDDLSAEARGAKGSRYTPGETIAGRYRIVRLLGRGGMGEVYLVDDLRLDHQVALKFLPPELAADPRRLAQFHSEVRIARQVSHPNVCRVYDIGEVDGELFLSMEYVEGTDLAAAIERIGTYPEAEAVELSRQICAGVAAAHDRGVLHRDLKPANIMINRAGRPQIMDFGLAVVGKAGGVIEGSPAYMSPEQLGGKDLNVRSDLYALGLIMYELFTGRRAFENAKTLDELASSRAAGTFAAPITLVGTINPEVNRAILACLEPDPARRPESAHAVSAMLQTQLLDASKSRGIQVAWASLGAGFLVAALRLTDLTVSARFGLALVGIVGAVGYFLYPLKWELVYKGHPVMFQIHPMWGERLYIDRVLVDRGRPGVNITLRGTIEAGDGAGERITAKSRAGLFTLSCRIVVEAFSAAGR